MFYSAPVSGANRYIQKKKKKKAHRTKDLQKNSEDIEEGQHTVSSNEVRSVRILISLVINHRNP